MLQNNDPCKLDMLKKIESLLNQERCLLRFE